VDLLDNLENDEFWEELCSQDISVLEEVVGELKRELADIDEERVLRRAEWDEFAAVERPQSEYRQALAEYSRWKADAFVLHRQISERKAQLITAMRDQVGNGSSSVARTIISRLVSAIIRHEDDDTMSDEDLYEVLDTTWFIASGRKMTLREFAQEGMKW